MKTVIVISEENHGFIGVATDMKAAFRFLIAEDWIDDLWDTDKQKYVYHTALFEKYGVGELFDLLWAMWEENEDNFDGMFYFNKSKVFE